MSGGKPSGKFDLHAPRNHNVRDIAQIVSTNKKRIRDLLRLGGYDFPWLDKNRMVEVLVGRPELTQAQRDRLEKYRSAGFVASGEATEASLNAATTPASNGALVPFSASNAAMEIDKRGRNTLIKELAQKLGIRHRTIYNWLHNANYKKPWTDRRRVLQICADNGVKRAATMLESAPQSLTSNRGRSRTVVVLQPGPDREVAERTQSALVYFRQARKQMFAEMQRTGRDRHTRSELAFMFGELELLGE